MRAAPERLDANGNPLALGAADHRVVTHRRTCIRHREERSAQYTTQNRARRVTTGIVLKLYGAAALALLLAACGAPKPRQSVPHGAIAAATPESNVGLVYHIDPAQSELRILVYRAGPIAALGHNHVIVNRAVSGSVEYAGSASSASFSWTMFKCAGTRAWTSRRVFRRTPSPARCAIC